MTNCWKKESAERKSFEDIEKYLKSIEENLSNFEKYPNIYPYDDISMLEKKLNSCDK